MAHVLHRRPRLLKAVVFLDLEYRTWRRCGPGARLTPKSLGFRTRVEVAIMETGPTEASQIECKLVHDVSWWWWWLRHFKLHTQQLPVYQIWVLLSWAAVAQLPASNKFLCCRAEPGRIKKMIDANLICFVTFSTIWMDNVDHKRMDMSTDRFVDKWTHVQQASVAWICCRSCCSSWSLSCRGNLGRHDVDQIV